MLGLLQWHFFIAPRWLAMLTWNLERVAARYFSAGLMVRTLVSHWHKDAVGYQQGTLGKIIIAFTWNMISRAIGFVVRTFVLVVYSITAVLVALVGVCVVALFLLWPAIMITALVISIQMIYGGF